MRLDWSPLWRALLADLEARIEPPLIAAKLHAGMADTVAEAGAELARRQGCNAIVLCGGVFQNKLFLERVSEKAGAMGFKVLSPAQFPAGDGGIALGQAIRPVCAVARMSPAILTVARAARHKANTERSGLLQKSPCVGNFSYRFGLRLHLPKFPAFGPLATKLQFPERGLLPHALCRRWLI